MTEFYQPNWKTSLLFIETTEQDIHQVNYKGKRRSHKIWLLLSISSLMYLDLSMTLVIHATISTCYLLTIVTLARMRQPHPRAAVGTVLLTVTFQNLSQMFIFIECSLDKKVLETSSQRVLQYLDYIFSKSFSPGLSIWGTLYLL